MSAVAPAEILSTPQTPHLHAVESARSSEQQMHTAEMNRWMLFFGVPALVGRLLRRPRVRHRRRVVDGPGDLGHPRRHLRARLARHELRHERPHRRARLALGALTLRFGALRRVVLIVNPYSTGVTRSRVAEVTAALARRAEVVVRQTEAPGPRGRARGRGGQGRRRARRVLGRRHLQRGDQRRRRDGSVRVRAGRRVERLPARPRAFPRSRRPPPAGAGGRSTRAGRSRSASAGSTGGSSASRPGIGFDAEAVRRIDARGRDQDGRRPGNAIFAATVFGMLFETRLRIPAQLSVEGYGRAAFIFVANGRPYTYAGPVAGDDLGGRRLRRRARLRCSARGLARERARARAQGIPRDAGRRPARVNRPRPRRIRGALRPSAAAPGRRRGSRRRDGGNLRRRARCPGRPRLGTPTPPRSTSPSGRG